MPADGSTTRTNSFECHVDGGCQAREGAAVGLARRPSARVRTVHRATAQQPVRAGPGTQRARRAWSSAAWAPSQFRWLRAIRRRRSSAFAMEAPRPPPSDRRCVVALDGACIAGSGSDAACGHELRHAPSRCPGAAVRRLAEARGFRAGVTGAYCRGPLCSFADPNTLRCPVNPSPTASLDSQFSRNAMIRLACRPVGTATTGPAR